MFEVNKINNMNEEEAYIVLKRCNGSSEWTRLMLASRPFTDADSLLKAADEIWFNLKKKDWLEGFNHHPRIGDLDSLKKKFSVTANWSAKEQSSVATASDKVLHELKSGNEAYESKFGFIFIVCASGKTAEEMLSLLKARLHNTSEDELAIALREHAKITRLRLEKLCRE